MLNMQLRSNSRHLRGTIDEGQHCNCLCCDKYKIHGKFSENSHRHYNSTYRCVEWGWNGIVALRLLQSFRERDCLVDLSASGFADSTDSGEEMLWLEGGNVSIAFSFACLFVSSALTAISDLQCFVSLSDVLQATSRCWLDERR